MHPLSSDLSKLSDEELHIKRSEIQNRIGQAYRFGNAEMIRQLQLFLDDYLIEIERRNRKMLEDAQKHSKAGQQDLDNKNLTSDEL